MTEVPKPPELLSRGGVWFQSGSVFLHLGVDEDFRPARKAHVALRCSDYDGLLGRLQTQAVPVTTDERRVEGRRHCYVADPFGNRIELIEGTSVDCARRSAEEATDRRA
jgi:catechol 2,3-dioxygenase-like lactoylglutathione lyase family enzyme